MGHLSAVERIEASASAGRADTPEQRALLAGSGAALAVGSTYPALMVLAYAAPPVAIGLALATPISLAVDVSSGALYGYPPLIVVIMAPSSFPDEDARNQFFADLEGRFEAALQQRRRENDAYCRTASTFELVKWKCDGLRQQERDLLATRNQWLRDMRAKTSISMPPEAP